MQYVRSLSGSVSKTWNSINPATLSGAIDVIVVEQENGDLACSPFHVRFGKFSLLRPYEKKVEFRVNGRKTDYSMKLGEGGEAFFVFETNAFVPAAMQTSPLVSPAGSPCQEATITDTEGLAEPEYLSIGDSQDVPQVLEPRRAQSDLGVSLTLEDAKRNQLPAGNEWPGASMSNLLGRTKSEEIVASSNRRYSSTQSTMSGRSRSPPPLDTAAAVERALALSRKLSISNVPTHVTDKGDVMLDMQGFKLDQHERREAEALAQKILMEEMDGDYDIGALIGADRHGNVWIYSSEEAKEQANREEGISMGIDAVSDAGYSSEDGRSESDSEERVRRNDRHSTPPSTPPDSPKPGDSNSSGPDTVSYAKTLRLTSAQLKSLDLKQGANEISFSVNRSTCNAFMYVWKHNVPIVISDIDGTITKSDALGHVFTMIGRDWTHLGVAKLYTDIANNGYNLLYLTSRGVGQADTTRNYLNGIVQENYRLPKGPVIMSPDRTMAALRREVYLRKPEVFKMACLRDILNLFGQKNNPFYAGFGNRLTDALSYRSVNIPSTRIFTINSNAEVSLDLLCVMGYRSGYVGMRDLVDHYFPPVETLADAEEYTDFNYWRENVIDVDALSDCSDDEHDREDEGEVEGEEEEEEEDEEEYDEEEDPEYAPEEEDEEYDDEADEENDPEEEEEDEDEQEENGEARRLEKSQGSAAGSLKPAMKMDLNQTRLQQAKQFAERELGGILEEVVGEVGRLTQTSQPGERIEGEAENPSAEEPDPAQMIKQEERKWTGKLDA